MTNVRSQFANAYESTLSADMGASATTASVVSMSGAPTSPCYMVIEPDSASRREYVYFDGTFGVSSFVTSSTSNRYLSGSAAGSGITHPAGSVIKQAPAKQHFDDLWDRTDALKAPAYLVTTSTTALDNEVAVGATPGGELGGTWASPTVDATHSGTSHAGVVTTHEAAGDPHPGYVLESLADAKGDIIAATAADTLTRLAVGSNDQVLTADSAQATGLKWAGVAPTSADYLVGTAQSGLSSEIVAGTSPGGELGGTWGSPTVDATHSGSAHTDFIAKALVDAKGDIIAATAADTVNRLAVGSAHQLIAADSSTSTGLRWKSRTVTRDAASSTTAITTSLADVAGISITFSTTSTNVVVVAYGTVDTDVTVAGASVAYCRLNVDGSDETEEIRRDIGLAGVLTNSTTWRVVLASTGSHTFKLRIAKTAGAGTVTYTATFTTLIVDYID
jgi:hypothetical protein